MPVPFEVPASAFRPFFTERVAFAATRKDGVHSGTVRACIFDESYADVFDETTGTSSRIRQITLEVSESEWSAAVSSPPQTGDKITSPRTSREYAVTEASPAVGRAWAITAREVK